MAAPMVTSEEIYPVLPEEAEDVYRGDTMKLILAAYLKSFTPTHVRGCKHKFPHFKTWWRTLNERQRERVKSALDAEVLHVFRG